MGATRKMAPNAAYVTMKVRERDLRLAERVLNRPADPGDVRDALRTLIAWMEPVK